MKKSHPAVWLCAVLLIILLSGCSEKLTLTAEFALSDEDRAYYVGDEFDSTVETKDGTLCRIPKIYATDGAGNKTEDLSHSRFVTYSGYDLSKPGKQTVCVTYRADGKRGEMTYDIEVKDQRVLFIEASDPMHLGYGAFRVGDKFTTYGKNADGEEVGVTVVLHMEDPSRPQVSCFTSHEMMKDLTVDTSACALDDTGAFTRAGIFTVHLTYHGLETDYQIRVEK